MFENYAMYVLHYSYAMYMGIYMSDFSKIPFFAQNGLGSCLDALWTPMRSPEQGVYVRLKLFVEILTLFYAQIYEFFEKRTIDFR